MSIKKYLEDQWLCFFITLFWLLLMSGLLKIFQVNLRLILMLVITYGILTGIVLVREIIRKKKHFDELKHHLSYLDQKYLILETMHEPSFYEGQLFWEVLYECNKSMCERVNDHKRSMDDFKNYIEMWVHEMKLPIAGLELMIHNSEEKEAVKYREQLRRMDQYTDQVLYYVRSQHMENDFLLKQTDLKKVITKVALKYREDLLMHKIDFRMEVPGGIVLTDGKWMEFILGQIVWNSMKYRDPDKESYILFFTEDKKNMVILNIYDNGIGIPPGDIKNVFKKSFTGENGRKYAKSTGMGLYIVKRLCDNLGHRVEIQSEQGKYTNLRIIFGKNNHFLHITKV